jgi:hypothetical protein
VSPVLDYGFDPLGFLDKLAASKARARLELDGALFEGPAYLPHPIVARTWAGHFPDEGGADDALLRRAGEMDPQRKHRGLGASWTVLLRWYAGVCKRPSGRIGVSTS